MEVRAGAKAGFVVHIAVLCGLLVVVIPAVGALGVVVGCVTDLHGPSAVEEEAYEFPLNFLKKWRK